MRRISIVLVSIAPRNGIPDNKIIHINYKHFLSCLTSTVYHRCFKYSTLIVACTFYIHGDMLPDAVDADFEGFGVQVIGDVPHVSPRAVIPSRSRRPDTIYICNRSEMASPVSFPVIFLYRLSVYVYHYDFTSSAYYIFVNH